MHSPASVGPEVVFPSGEPRPALGLGTWRFGEQPSRRASEVAAVRQAVDIGYRVFDTAEMYGDGGSEEITGQALADAQRAGLARSDVFVVSKALPHHAGEDALQRACEGGLSMRSCGLGFNSRVPRSAIVTCLS